MTKQQAARIVQNAKRCTSATLKALGIPAPGPRPTNAMEVTQRILRAGHTIKACGARGQRVWEFVLAHPTGRYYLVTDGHAMALVDGILVDTERRGPDGRELLGAFEVVPL